MPSRSFLHSQKILAYVTPANYADFILKLSSFVVLLPFFCEEHSNNYSWWLIMSLCSEGIQFLREIYERRQQIYNLTKRDFTNRYAGSFLGLIWAFIEPLAMMCIIWGVFSFGFRAGGTSNGIPFIAYLFTGMTAYNFFSGAIGSSSNVIHSFSFLVKKVKFRIAILPLVKLNSALIIHLIFLVILMPILLASGITPTIYWFQVLYYMFALIFLMLGLSWFVSALGVFIKDVANAIQILLTFGFWMTPIFWNIEMIPEKYRMYLFLNPLLYIIQGYRDSFLYQTGFWEHPISGLYYWSFSGVILIVGILVFKKLRPHFADVI